jgi:hypothetical protein
MSERPIPPPSPEVEDEEILDSGQEEVFSRTEVELGRIEHASGADRTPDAGKPG